MQRQINVLRRLPEAKTIPIEITEFGTLDAENAPGFLLRNYCQMALSGVDRAVWYPMHPRGDGLVPVVDDAGRPTPTGRAFGFAQTEFSGLPVEPIQPDPFTYGCLFDQRKLVIWGEPREIGIPPALTAFTATGLLLDQGNLSLSPIAPLVIISSEPLQMARDITLTPQRLLADSFHQLDYPKLGALPAKSVWQNSILHNGTEQTFQTMPGQERQGVPWVPYLGHADFPDLRLAAEFLVPTQKDGSDVSVVQSYTAPYDVAVSIDARWKVSSKSEDGIGLVILVNDTPIMEQQVKTELHIKDRHIFFKRGDRLRFSISPNDTPWVDYTEHRIRLSADIFPTSELLRTK
ncbi:hypothetical protein [Neptunicoccus cionae]|uniref:Uncharacterized protein n=1 Tax=Neptunicoccus cionae TaxID=2035344 RepID=A0A916QU18_9RHOB|nr:hypothetical protein [Amylibacter cionae]GGA09855.1 hypothetical protein GCM10011498_07380 [Amylibacter cionae]